MNTLNPAKTCFGLLNNAHRLLAISSVALVSLLCAGCESVSPQTPTSGLSHFEPWPGYDADTSTNHEASHKAWQQGQEMKVHEARWQRAREYAKAHPDAPTPLLKHFADGSVAVGMDEE